MRRRSKQALCFIFFFFLSFFILLYAVTVYRENSYDNLVQSFQLSEEIRHQKMDEEREFQREYLRKFAAEPPLDEIFNDPVMIEYIAETHVIALEYEYDFTFVLLSEIGKREPPVFPLRFFYVYGKLYSFENLHHVGAQGFVLGINLGPFFDGDTVFDSMGAAIYAWESEGNTREGEWLDRFLASPEYEAFLQDLYTKIEPSEEKSLESIVKEIHDVPTESQNPLSYLKTPFLEDAKRLTTMVYESYQRGKQQRDITRVTFEARILQELYEKVLYVEELSPNQFRNLRWSRPYLPDPFVDLAGILVGAVIISLLATFLLSRKSFS